MAQNTNKISSIAMGRYFGGEMQGHTVDSQPVYIDDKMHIQTKIKKNNEIVCIVSMPTVKSHKEAARRMQKDIVAFINE